jgi:tRNA threonylcarbamoyladenosine modification (KEOPS) complex Cgi121 subunit
LKRGSICAEARLEPAETERRILELRSSNPDLVIQVASMDELPREKAVRMIAEQTLRAMETGALLASRPEVDLLLRLAGTRQIAVAMERCGYRVPGRKLLVALGPEEPLEKLRERLAREKDFTLLEGQEIDEKGLWMVETAALLASRN